MVNSASLPVTQNDVKWDLACVMVLLVEQITSVVGREGINQFIVKVFSLLDSSFLADLCGTYDL